MNNFFPKTGSEAEWNAAYYRLEDYLRALHVVNKVHQSQIILSILRGAAAKHALNPDLNPTELAMEEAWLHMDEWFKGMLPGDDHFAVAGRVSLLITDATEKWPMVLLAKEVPSEFVRAMQESKVQAGPDLRVSSMVPRPLDAGSPVEEGHAEHPRRSDWIFAVVLVCWLVSLAVVIFTG